MFASLQSEPYTFLPSAVWYICVVPSHTETEMVCVTNRICRSNGIWPPRLGQWRHFSFCPGLLDYSLQEESLRCGDSRQVCRGAQVERNWGFFSAVNPNLSTLCTSHPLGRFFHPSQIPGPQKLWAVLSSYCYFKWLNFRIICYLAVDNTVCKKKIASECDSELNLIL